MRLMDEIVVCPNSTHPQILDEHMDPSLSFGISEKSCHLLFAQL
jgi:hypothetical protein